MNGPFRTHFRWRLAAIHFAILLSLFAATGVALSLLIGSDYRSLAVKDLRRRAEVASRRIEAEPGFMRHRAYLSGTSLLLDQDLGARVVIYGGRGRLFADSRPGSSDPPGVLRARARLHVYGEGTKTVGYVELRSIGHSPETESLPFSRTIVLTILLASLAACFLIYCLTGRTAGPIARMNEMARAMAAGDLDQRVEVHSPDEIGELARSLNDLAQQLRHTIDELADQRGRMETILASMTDAIVVTDEHGRIVVFNQAGERMFRRSSKEALNAPVRSADLHPQIAAMAEECASTGEVTHREIRLPGAEEATLSATASPLRHGNGKTIGCVVILHDLTEIRKRGRLEKEFVANASHELRTPITAIRVTAEALISGAKQDPKVMDRFLKSMVSESERLSALIDDLLDIAKRDAGQQPLDRAKVPLTEICKRACGYWKPEAEKWGLTLECNLPDDVFLLADQRQMGQVLDNLLSNAVKYTPQGGRINLSADAEDDWVAISVSDTGVGIPQGDIPRVFERFYRVDKTRSRRLGGTGLGLSIVRDIVESHGGRVTVESELGKGSTFTVTIPRWEGSDE